MKPLHRATPPHTHAGHHNTHTVTPVHTLSTLQAHAAAAITSSKLLFVTLPKTYNAAGGDVAIMTNTDNTPNETFTPIGHVRGGEKGRTNDKGEARSPTNRACEKLSVARVDRAAPSKSREKHWMSVNV
jgi:hypothetical protein